MGAARPAPQGLTIYLLSKRNYKGGLGFMVLRVRPAPNRFTITILYTPLDNTPLHSIPRV